jgi:7-cyano-7-deazaguanine reductase
MSGALHTRARLSVLTGSAPWLGADFWFCPEFFWRNPRGKPEPAVLSLTLPTDSPHVLEREALAGLCNEQGDAEGADAMDGVREALRSRLAQALWQGAPVRTSPGVRLVPVEQARWPEALPAEVSPDHALDRLDIERPQVPAAMGMLQAALNEKPVKERLFSDLLRMPAAGGGWELARLELSYEGPQIDAGALLSYVLAWEGRSVPLSHWADVLASELMGACKPTKLSLVLRVARRQGVALTSWRTNYPQQPPAWALWHLQ